MSHFSYTPPFQGPHILTKMLESNILYDNLLIDILSVWWHQKNIEITHANQSATSNAILTKMPVQLECLYFLFAFCPRNYPWWSLWQKNTKNKCFIQVKPPLLVVEVSNTVTFWRNARFDVILTSVTIIKTEVSSIMRELAGRSLTGTYLYLLCVKPGISTTSASKRSHS